MASYIKISHRGVSKPVVSITGVAKACLSSLKSFYFDLLFSKMLVITLEHFRNLEHA